MDGVAGVRADVEAEAKEQVGGGEVDSGAVVQSMVVSLVGNSAEVERQRVEMEFLVWATVAETVVGKAPSAGVEGTLVNPACILLPGSSPPAVCTALPSGRNREDVLRTPWRRRGSRRQPVPRRG